YFACAHRSPRGRKRLPRPHVGHKPVPPQRNDGKTMAQIFSFPIEKPTKPADVAEAGPADEPLEPRRSSLGTQGLRVTPPNHFGPCASAPIESLATSTAPASRSRSTTVAS